VELDKISEAVVETVIEDFCGPDLGLRVVRLCLAEVGEQ
jgi:hypothetical protein